MPIRHSIALSYAIWPRRHFTMLWVVPEARSTANWPSLLTSRALAARPSAILPLLKAELPPKHWLGTAVRYGPFIKLDEASLGELLMHFMPETIIAAHLRGIVQANRPAPLRPGPSHGCVRPSDVHLGYRSAGPEWRFSLFPRCIFSGIGQFLRSISRRWKRARCWRRSI